MKKSVFVFTLFFVLISLSFISAAEDTNENVQKAYACLKDKIDDRTCEKLSLEEKIFSLLAVGQCQQELIDESSSDDCWPSGDCDIKSTSQAVLALSNSGSNVNDAKDWLLSKKQTPSDMDWYLQIETDDIASCTVFYDSDDYIVNINEDKTLSGNGGPCLGVSPNGYWLEVSSSTTLGCYEKEFEISCNQDFLTNLLFTESGSSTIHVSGITSSASSGGVTSEKINSFCFSKGISCDYEGTLWASLALNSVNEETNSYLPYLIVKKDSQDDYLPESFLYTITNDADYQTSLLDKQKLNKYWQESGDRYYDTAVALLPFHNKDVAQKTNSKEWLLEDVQESNGCWDNGNVKNTAFLLYSIWPDTSFIGNGGETLDCESSDYYCSSGATCQDSGGTILDDYSGCSFPSKCCNVPPLEQTCSYLGGDICASDEVCVGGYSEDTADIGYGQICCVKGSCQTSGKTELTDCEIESGVCRSYDCFDDESESSASCDSGGETCCISKSVPPPKPIKWIVILLILIVIVVIGIVFREKLRRLWFKTKSGFRGGRSPSSRYGGPRRPGPPPAPLMGRGYPGEAISSRPLPSQVPRRKSPLKSQHEIDDVLKKLKEMGK